VSLSGAEKTRPIRKPIIRVDPASSGFLRVLCGF
jgi:hypothetical protein